jgi:hypothetical protein
MRLAATKRSTGDMAAQLGDCLGVCGAGNLGGAPLVREGVIVDRQLRKGVSRPPLSCARSNCPDLDGGHFILCGRARHVRGSP